MKNPIKPRNTAFAAAITGRKGGIHWTAENQHEEAKKPAVGQPTFALYVGPGPLMRPIDFVHDFDTTEEAAEAGTEIIRDAFGSKYWIVRHD